MWSALLQLLTHRPELLVRHVSGYADIAQSELRMLRKYWLQRALLGILALLVFVVAVAVGAVATTLALGDIAVASWALFAPAIVLLVLAIALAIAAALVKPALPHSSTLDMFRKDLDLLSELGARS
jgi:hypothetical protein